MTDRELEGRLRAWYRTEVGEGETAPLPLRSDVAAIPREGRAACPVVRPGPRPHAARGRRPAARRRRRGRGGLRPRAGCRGWCRRSRFPRWPSSPRRRRPRSPPARWSHPRRRRPRLPPPGRAPDRLHPDHRKAEHGQLRRGPGAHVSGSSTVDRRFGREWRSRAVPGWRDQPGRSDMVAGRDPPALRGHWRVLPDRRERQRAPAGGHRLCRALPARSSKPRSRATARKLVFLRNSLDASGIHGCREHRNAGPRQRPGHGAQLDG